MTDPTKARCWDKTWKYVPRDATDISKTFAKARKQQKEEAAQKLAHAVTPIKRRA